MVPIPESTYFPALEKCLDGEHHLISWRAIYVALLEDDYDDQVHRTLESFLTEPYVLQLLGQPYDPYSSTETSTTSAFETKTAAINVTPTTKTGYDIAQIKDDALWLSKEAQIDEISALRVVVLELQTRSHAQLRSDFSDEEIVSLQEAAGKANTELTSVLPQAALAGGSSGGGAADLNSQRERRTRALRLYLLERRYLVKCAGLFLHSALEQQRDEDSSNGKAKGKETGVGTTWTRLVGESFLVSLRQADRTLQDLFSDSIKSLRRTFRGLYYGSGWFKQDGGREDLEIDWYRSNMIEAVHTMEIIFRILSYEKHLPQAETVLEWLSFVSMYGFFDKFTPSFPGMESLVVHLQSLVAIISLSLVEPQKTLEYFYDPEDNGFLMENEKRYTPYISDLQTISELHKTLSNAACGQSTVASPAILAWCIILKAMRDSSIARREAGELRQSVRAEQELQDDAFFDDDSPSGLRAGRQAASRRFSTGSESSAEAGIYDEFLETIRDSTPEADPISFLVTNAIDGSNVFDLLTSLAEFFNESSPIDTLGVNIRLVILALARCSIELLDYTPEIVTTVLASLAGDQNFWNLLQSQPISRSQDPLVLFLEDDYFVQRLLETALSRFPYERLPFLKLIRVVAACRILHDEGMPLAGRTLGNMPSFTFQLPKGFRGYETIQEEDNANTIQLTQDVLLFQPRRMMRVIDGRSTGLSGSLALSQIYADFTIPRGAQGRIVSDLDSGPKVSIWSHHYSGLKYMGKLLETALIAGDSVEAVTGEEADRESVAEMIGIFATLLLTCTQIGKSNDNVEPHGSAYQILEEASDGLDRSRDIVTVIFKLFEEELQRQSTSSDNDSSLDILVASIQFIYALVPVLPGRVWPLLSRSELLEIDGRGGKLSAILGRSEIVSCHYDFLISCTHLFQALVGDSVNNAILRQTGAKALVRLGSKEDLGTGVPEQVLSKILLSFTRTMMDVFESSYNWRFAIPEQRVQLLDLTSTLLHSILQYAHGVDDTPSPDAKLTRVLVPASENIIESFLSVKTGHLRFRSLLRTFVNGFSVPDLTLQPGSAARYLGEVRGALAFTTTLLKLARLLGRQSSLLEDQLFKSSPLIARLYAAHESYHTPVVKLFEALVLCASSREGEPPSLLGHLGRTTSRNFIHVLLDFEKPLDDDPKSISIWNFMSVIVSSRQQWFSIYLLTGRPPREALKGSLIEKALPAARTLLKIVLTALSDIPNLSKAKALSMLEFVSLAQNYWPWVVMDLQQKQSSFIKSMCAFVTDMQPVPASLSEKPSIDSCYHIRMAAYIAEILAMYLYHMRQIGNTSVASDILQHLTFYTKCAVSLPQYNSSLQGNLKRNFEAKFSGCSLDNFKRTRLNTRDYGRDYFYDIRFAEKMLHSSQAWTGRKNDGLGEEIAKSNVNLSLVDAQVALLYGWKLLAIELSTNLAEKPDLHATMAKVVKDLFISNSRSRLPENVFARLTLARADFALTLMQRLIESNCVEPEVLGLLSKVWEMIRSLDTSFEAILADGGGEYYRSLLKMLFLALRAHIGRGKEASEASKEPKGPSDTPSSPVAGKIQSASALVQTILDILGQVVARGFRDLVAAIHERPTESVAEDIGLVTGILQSCLCVPGIEFSHHQIVESMASFDAARVAITLFSWSDKLAIDGDPIYGELSIRFLLEISTLPAMAEQIAIQGVLGHIGNASITSYIRRGNISSLSEGIGPQRCYRIWAHGILTLLLNILDAVGGSISAEVALFLNQFPKLLQQSVEAIEVPHSTLGRRAMEPSRITYSMVSEVHSVALLIHVLSSFRVALAGITEVPEVKWDSASVLESVEHWIMERAVLRERILPTGVREMEMAKQKPLSGGLGCENRLEEKVVHELYGVRDVLTGAEA